MLYESLKIVLKSSPYEKSIALLDAAKNKHEDAFNFLIEKGADINFALLNAAKNKHEDGFNFLITKGAEINLALLMAVMTKHEDAFDFLIAKGANKDCILFGAALNRHEVAFDFLIAKGADINVALSMAINQKKDAAADFLIEKGADKNVAKNTHEAALILLSLKDSDSSVKKDHIASSSEGNDKQGGGDSNKIISPTITKKRTLNVNNEEDEEITVSSSSKADKTHDNSNASSASKDVGRNKHSSENDELTKKKSIICELKTKLKNQYVHLKQEEYELDKAQQELINMLPKEETIETEEETITRKEAEIEFYSEHTPMSIVYQFGKWAYGLLTEKSLNSELIFGDKASMMVFPSFNYDQDLPKLDMLGSDSGGSLLINTYEIS